ncbi:MAG: hypothetical protein JWR18_74 [Segetibacter sp.]|jgi:shikimate kinase|nr:hypothetical protein [Segetibacter sp.]
MNTITTKKTSRSISTTSSDNTVTQPKIFLIGMMGSGKSFWAEKLKKKLKVPAYDLDSLIEMMEERSIKEIFEEDGEEYFRKAEAKMLRLFSEKKQFILSCGGGTACYNDNMKWMNKNGITIWIDEPIETLSDRLSKEKSHRPLIKDLDDEGLNNFLQKNLQERSVFYDQSAYRLNGEKLSESAFTKIIKDHA